MSEYKDLLKHQHTTKERVVYVMGESCQLCGYNKCNKALELHHINPKEKESSISGNLLNNSWDKLCGELQKCILLCSNCHKEVHDNLDNFSFISSFNLEKASEIKELIYDLNHHKYYYCKSCGKKIYNSGLCLECSNLNKRISERPNREVLKNEIRKIPFLTLGKKYNVSDSAIRKWCKSENLPSTKKEISSYSDEEWDIL